MQPPRALVIGGTGMLAGVCLRLLDYGFDLVVVGRHQSNHVPLARHAERVARRYVDLCVDWSDLPTLRSLVRSHGPYDLTVTWTHGDPRPVAEIAQESGAAGARHHVVRSSASAAPGGLRLGPPAREIVLGWKREANRSRWLTHEEICDGVWSAIQSGVEFAVVGVTEPWGERP